MYGRCVSSVSVRVDALWSSPQVHQEFVVAFGAENRGVDDAHAGQSYRSGGRRHGLDHARVYCRVTDQAATPDFLAACFELRFHERYDIGVAGQQRRHDRENVRQRNERDVDRHDAGAVSQVGQRRWRQACAR